LVVVLRAGFAALVVFFAVISMHLAVL